MDHFTLLCWFNVLQCVENIGHRFALLKELVTNVPHGAPLEGHPPSAAGPQQHRDLTGGGGGEDDAAGQEVEGGLEREGRCDVKWQMCKEFTVCSSKVRHAALNVIQLILAQGLVHPA